MMYSEATVQMVLKKFNTIQQEKTGVNTRLKASKDSNRIATEELLAKAENITEVYRFFQEVDFDACFEDYCMGFEIWKARNSTPEVKETTTTESADLSVIRELSTVMSEMSIGTNRAIREMAEDNNRKFSELTSALKTLIEASTPAEKNVVLKVNNVPKIEGEIVHPQFEKVLNMVNNNIAPYLVGEAGTGKSHIVEQVAKALNLDFYFSHCVTNEFQLTGFIDANGNYIETEFYKAFTNGGIFMLDEIDASVPEALTTINTALANGYFDFPCGAVKRHEDFRVVAAGNTIGKGGNEKYTSRSMLDSASLNRFMPLPIDYSIEIEKAVTGNNLELISFAHSLRKAIREQGSDIIVSYRDLDRINKLEGCWDSLSDLLECQFFLGRDEDEKMLIKNSMENISGNKYYQAL